MSEQVINSKASLDAYIAHIHAQFDKHKYLRMDMKTGKQRSLPQNSAIHVYFDLLSRELNEAGHDVRETLKDGIPVRWTPELVKEHLWKPIQLALIGEESTTKMKRYDVDKVYEILNFALGSKLGIHMPFPSKENQ